MKRPQKNEVGSNFGPRNSAFGFLFIGAAFENRFTHKKHRGTNKICSFGNHSTDTRVYGERVKVVTPLRGLEQLGGRHSGGFTPGYHISGFQPSLSVGLRKRLDFTFHSPTTPANSGASPVIAHPPLGIQSCASHPPSPISSPGNRWPAARFVSSGSERI